MKQHDGIRSDTEYLVFPINSTILYLYCLCAARPQQPTKAHHESVVGVSLFDPHSFQVGNYMHPRSFLLATVIGLTLIGCGKPERPPPSTQLAEVTKERDRERAARIEADAARQKAESHSMTLMFAAALGCTVALFAGIALGSSALRRSSPTTGLQRGQADE